MSFSREIISRDRAGLPAGAGNYLGFNGTSAVIDGQNARFNSIVFNDSSGIEKPFQDFFGNKLTALPVCFIGAADTLIANVSINGLPAIVAVQANTGGALAAIIYNFSDHLRDTRSISVILTFSGTAPTAGRADYFTFYSLRNRQPVSTDSVTTTIATAQTSNAYLQSALVIAAATNDQATGNSCTWTSTGVITETNDAAIGTARCSFAYRGVSTSTVTSGITSTATWVTPSVAGASLVVASFM
jgi:hypothetical protein